MDWKTYEELVKNIYEALGKDTGVSIECFGNTCKVIGKSKVEHQIDVLTKHSDGLHSYRTAIECKYWDKKINKDIVMKVADIVEDSGLNKGVIVSKLGFTEDAIKTAENRNIGLVELREPTEEDWKGRIKNIVIDMNMLLPQITKVEPILIEIPKDGKLTTLSIDTFSVKEKDGTIHNIKAIAKEFFTELTKQDEGKEFSKVYLFNEGAILTDNTPNVNLKISGVKFFGYLKISKNRIEIKGEDHIWLVMKTIFENKRFTILKDGKINKHE